MKCQACQDRERHERVAQDHLDAGLPVDHPLVVRALRLAERNRWMARHPIVLADPQPCEAAS